MDDKRPCRKKQGGTLSSSSESLRYDITERKKGKGRGGIWIFPLFIYLILPRIKISSESQRKSKKEVYSLQHESNISKSPAFLIVTDAAMSTLFTYNIYIYICDKCIRKWCKYHNLESNNVQYVSQILSSYNCKINYVFEIFYKSILL